MENFLIYLFIFAPLVSLGVYYSLYRKDAHDEEHFFHVFSITYLITLLFGEISNLLINRNYLWFIFIVSFLAIVSLAHDLSKRYEIFSHNHHGKFSKALVVVFCLHSFFDGLLFDTGHLKPGLAIHRLIDGFVVLGLLNAGGLRLHFWRTLNLRKFLVMLVFTLAPVLGMYLPTTNPEFFEHVQKILLFVFVVLLTLDVLSEFSHRHHSSNNKIFFAAILIGIVLGLFTLH